MKKIPFFIRIFLSYLVLLLFEGILFYLFFTTFHRKIIVDMATSSLLNIANMLKPEVQRLYSGNNFSTLDSVVKVWGKEGTVRITIIDTDGTVLADSKNDPSTMENHKYRPEILKAIEGGVGIAIRHSPTMNTKMLYVAVPLQYDNRNLVIRTSIPLKNLDLLSYSINKKVGIVTIILALAALFIAVLLTKDIYAPIKELTNFSSRLSKGNFGSTLILNRNDEIGKLTKSFNEMSQKLKELFDEADEQKKTLESILTAVPDAIVLLDGEGRVVYANHIFRHSFQKEVEGRYYWEIPVLSSLSNLIGGYFERGDTGKARLFYEGRFYEVFIKGTDRKNSVVILRDITDNKKLEEIKKQLVSNVSHELRTPLTAIKGYIEVLEDMVSSKEALDYIDIVKRHTERLINLTNDLLLLDEIESVGISSKKPVNLQRCVENVIKIYQKRFLDKGVELKVDIQNDVSILGDEIKIEQMLINLVDNALKYTEKGHVIVRIKGEGNYAVIEVEDTGIGIPKEHIPRIFERFYVVDKSRSKETGGTGLGLSIVKHIVRIHGGKIEVRSEPGIGTTFTIMLPLGNNPEGR